MAKINNLNYSIFFRIYLLKCNSEIVGDPKFLNFLSQFPLVWSPFGARYIPCMRTPSKSYANPLQIRRAKGGWTHTVLTSCVVVFCAQCSLQ